MQPLQVFFEDKNRVLPYKDANFDQKRKESYKNAQQITKANAQKNANSKMFIGTYKERQLKHPILNYQSWLNLSGWPLDVVVHCHGYANL